MNMIQGKLIHPQVLAALARAGHGSKVLISDGNYPHWTTRGPNAEVVYLNLAPGLVSGTEVLRALTTVIPIIGTVLSCSLAGFAFARLRVRFAGVLFAVVLASEFLRGTLGQIALYPLLGAFPGGSSFVTALCTACTEQLTGSTFLQHLNAGGDTLAGVKYTVIETMYDEVVTPFTPTDWKMTFDGETVSLRPSIGNWNDACRSHYVIERGRVIEALPWADWQVEAEWQAARAQGPRLEASEVDRVRSHFVPPAYEDLQNIDAAAGRTPEFQAWYRYNTREHKVPGYRAVFISLKRHGENPGDITSDQMDAVAALADRFSFGMIRVSHNQNLLLGDVRQDDLPLVWQELSGLGLAMMARVR